MIYYPSISIFILLVYLFVSWQIRKIVWIPLTYFVVRAIYDFGVPRLLDPHLGRMNEYLIQRQALLTVITILGMIILSSKIRTKVLVYLLILLASLDSFIITKWPWDQGFLTNQAQDACFIMLCAPLVLFTRFRYWGIVLVGAALKAGSATSLLILFAEVSVFYPIVIPIGVGFVASTYKLWPVFWHDNGRLFAWDQAFQNVAAHHPWMGYGAFSYFLYGPAWNIARQGFHNNAPAFTWLHNDYMEILFGFGLIGLASFLFIIGRAVCRLKSDKYSFAVLAGLLVTMGFQMPLSQPLFWLVILFLVRRVIGQEKSAF